MPPQYNKLPAFNVISYLWDGLVNAEILDPTDYYVDEFEDEIIPIVPVQDLPQTRNYLGDKPYIVYEVINLPIQDGQFYMKQEELIFAVYSPSFSKLVEICMLAEDLLNRSSLTGHDITKYSNSQFTFHCFNTEYQIVGPSESEGGRMEAMIVVTYEYTRDLTASGRYSQ